MKNIWLESEPLNHLNPLVLSDDPTAVERITNRRRPNEPPSRAFEEAQRPTDFHNPRPHSRG
jgi:hypothetical protein